MGDPRRFTIFAKFLSHHIDPQAKIADIAGGKGGLRTALYQYDYKDVTTWDIRKRLAKNRAKQKYGLFLYNSAPSGYDALIAMHPDEATDHAVLYAAKHKIPAYICPCCIKPSAVPYFGIDFHRSWNDHLRRLAEKYGLKTQWVELPITGRNLVLICRP